MFRKNFCVNFRSTVYKWQGHDKIHDHRLKLGDKLLNKQMVPKKERVKKEVLAKYTMKMKQN